MCVIYLSNCLAMHFYLFIACISLSILYKSNLHVTTCIIFITVLIFTCISLLIFLIFFWVGGGYRWLLEHAVNVDSWIE